VRIYFSYGSYFRLPFPFFCKFPKAFPIAEICRKSFTQVGLREMIFSFNNSRAVLKSITILLKSTFGVLLILAKSPYFSGNKMWRKISSEKF